MFLGQGKAGKKYCSRVGKLYNVRIRMVFDDFTVRSVHQTARVGQALFDGI